MWVCGEVSTVPNGGRKDGNASPNIRQMFARLHQENSNSTVVKGLWLVERKFSHHLAAEEWTVRRHLTAEQRFKLSVREVPHTPDEKGEYVVVWRKTGENGFTKHQSNVSKPAARHRGKVCGLKESFHIIQQWEEGRVIFHSKLEHRFRSSSKGTAQEDV